MKFRLLRTGTLATQAMERSVRIREVSILVRSLMTMLLVSTDSLECLHLHLTCSGIGIAE